MTRFLCVLWIVTQVILAQGAHAQHPELLSKFKTAMDDDERLFIAAIIIDQMKSPRETAKVLMWSDTLYKYGMSENNQPALAYMHFTRINAYARLGKHKQVLSEFNALQRIGEAAELEPWRMVLAQTLAAPRMALYDDKEHALVLLEKTYHNAMAIEDTASILRVLSQEVLVGIATADRVWTGLVMQRLEEKLSQLPHVSKTPLFRYATLFHIQENIWLISLVLVILYFYHLVYYMQKAQKTSLIFMSLLLVVLSYLWLSFSFFGASPFSITYLGYDAAALLMYALLGGIVVLFALLQRALTLSNGLSAFLMPGMGIYVLSIVFAYVQTSLLSTPASISPAAVAMVLMIVFVLLGKMNEIAQAHSFWLTLGNIAILLSGMLMVVCLNWVYIPETTIAGYVLIGAFLLGVLSLSRSVKSLSV